MIDQPCHLNPARFAAPPAPDAARFAAKAAPTGLAPRTRGSGLDRERRARCFAAPPDPGAARFAAQAAPTGLARAYVGAVPTANRHGARHE